MSTVYDAIYGNMIGQLQGCSHLKFEDGTNHDILANEYFNTSDIFNIERAICNSIANLKAIDLPIIMDRLTHMKHTSDAQDGDVLCWIFPIGFFTIYNHAGSMSENVAAICNVTHSYEPTKLVCIEYVRLIHDIFWKYVTPKDLLKILPELDILAGDVKVSRDARDVFFGALWAFVHSTDFCSALNNVRELNPSNNWISCVTGTIAGLYYGIADMPETWIETSGIEPYIQQIIF